MHAAPTIISKTTKSTLCNFIQTKNLWKLTKMFKILCGMNVWIQMGFLTKNLLLSAYILLFEFPIKRKNLKKIVWQYSTVLPGDMIKMQKKTNLHKHSWTNFTFWNQIQCTNRQEHFQHIYSKYLILNSTKHEYHTIYFLSCYFICIYTIAVVTKDGHYILNDQHTKYMYKST